MDTQADEYERFVRARTPALLRSAYLLTGDQHLAEDLVQEALARTHRSWRRLVESGNAEAYARKIMYHTQVSVWRRRRVAEFFPGTLPDVVGRGTGDHADLTTVRLALQRALGALTPRQRAVIVLRYFEDRTESEAAEMLGVAVGTVKVLAARALQRLRSRAPELNELLAMEGTDR
jgi:RNA polymerase sigma-70 factor (sigma-E family)